MGHYTENAFEMPNKL